MNLSSNFYDIVFIGHMCFDEVIPYQGPPRIAPGSAVLCGALAAARVSKKVAVVTQMAPRDQKILEPLRKNGVAIHIIPSAQTTYMKVVHRSADVDEREIYQLADAGFFSLANLPPLAARRVHLAGVTDREFDLDFIRGLKEKGYSLSVDMQSFVRQVQPHNHQIAFQDVPAKLEIVRQMDMVKLDIVEAKVLTGTQDLEQAARKIEYWGCPEVVITQAEGVLAQVGGQTFYEKFSNRSAVGRTGRGDTTFAAYLARRLDHNVVDSLKFAAALVSIKMEAPGPFSGTLADVMARMQAAHTN
ncbi:MAG TPA: PfkB family carbohydrate kinase [Anaerolineales bacterium]|nr:PfkB family carbohydrate kinase [Anaerolineales bacterium]